MENLHSDQEIAEVFGEKMKKFRLKSNLSYEQVFAKTRISEMFTIDLENELWNKLPPYAYSRGLLQNLLEEYSVSPETRDSILKEFAEIWQIYRSDSANPSSAKTDHLPKAPISAAPEKTEINLSSEDNLSPILKIPGDEEDPHSEEKQLEKKIFSGIWWAVSLGAVIIVIILAFYFRNITEWLGSKDSSEFSTVSSFVRNSGKITQGIYSLYSKFNTFDLVKDDVVKIFFKNHIYNFRLTGIDNTFDNRLLVNFDFNNERIFKVYLFEEVWVDIDQDGINDLLIKFQKNSGEVAIVFFSLAEELQQEINYDSIWSSQEKLKIKKGEMVLLKDQNKTPIQVYLKATTLPVHFTYNIDGQRQNTVNLSPGNTVNLIANDHMELQIGNFRSVVMILNLIPITFYVDNPYQFGITKIVKWLPSFRNETKYDLIIKDYIE